MQEQESVLDDDSNKKTNLVLDLNETSANKLIHASDKKGTKDSSRSIILSILYFIQTNDRNNSQMKMKNIILNKNSKIHLKTFVFDSLEEM
jgi:hypothetical protein